MVGTNLPGKPLGSWAARNLIRVVALVLAVSSATGCSIEASIFDTSSPSAIPNVSLTRTDPDFLSGEVVTTANGTTVRAVFGEVAEKQVLSSGHVIEGVVQ